MITFIFGFSGASAMTDNRGIHAGPSQIDPRSSALDLAATKIA